MWKLGTRRIPNRSSKHWLLRPSYRISTHKIFELKYRNKYSISEIWNQIGYGFHRLDDWESKHFTFFDSSTQKLGYINYFKTENLRGSEISRYNFWQLWVEYARNNIYSIILKYHFIIILVSLSCFLAWTSICYMQLYSGGNIFANSLIDSESLSEESKNL